MSIPDFALKAALKGIPVRAEIYLPEFKEGHKRERKWARRVMFERWRRFDVRKDRVVYFFDGTLLCHPNTYDLIKKLCEKKTLDRLSEPLAITSKALYSSLAPNTGGCEMHYHYSESAGYYGNGGWVCFSYDWRGLKDVCKVFGTEQEAKEYCGKPNP